ncbi:homoserine kinase [Paenibacillus macquariensis subsp. defensor]|nr:homoserine kinase [Paenibacillus macquariensis subsp. defensor]
MEQHTHPLLLELQASSLELFGIEIYSWEPISLGWLNLKWRLETDQGDFLLKIYHRNRYSNEDVLVRALQQQQRVYQSGVPCPELLSHKGVLLHSLCDEKFIIMRFCSGNIMRSHDINVDQMFDLGTVTSKIHRILNDTSLGVESSPQFVPQSRNERLSHWDDVMKEADRDNKTQLLSHLELHRTLTETMDIESFGKCEAGWSHRDLWVDNLLFHENKVSSVLDFDRLNYDYPELDVARAIMSWALVDGNLRIDIVAAFLKGYREYNRFDSGMLVRSLRMLWYMESVWWITANMELHNKVQVRFAEEMTWLAENDERLPMIVGDL